MKNRYYDTNKKGQTVYGGENPPSHLIKDDDERVINFFQPTPNGYRKAYDENGLPFNELLPPKPAPTETELKSKYKGYQQEHILKELNKRDYDSLQNLALYNSNIESMFYTEVLSLTKWNEACVIKGYQIFDAVKAGTREIPTQEGYLNELPKVETFFI